MNWTNPNITNLQAFEQISIRETNNGGFEGGREGGRPSQQWGLGEERKRRAYMKN